MASTRRRDAGYAEKPPEGKIMGLFSSSKKASHHTLSIRAEQSGRAVLGLAKLPKMPLAKGKGTVKGASTGQQRQAHNS